MYFAWCLNNLAYFWNLGVLVTISNIQNKSVINDKKGKQFSILLM